MSRRPLIAGNWKMNGLTGPVKSLAQAIKNGWTSPENMQRRAGLPVSENPTSPELLVCPPATALSAVAAALKGSPISLGGQDCHAKKAGAHTGDISAAMLKDLGCDYVIVGHSERRTDHGEDDEDVHAKAEAAHGTGLIPIICIGETKAEREAGKTLDVVLRQLVGSCPTGLNGASVVIAYEPVWAIGTGRTPTNDEVQEVHAALRNGLDSHLNAEAADGIRILYGGSMKPDNAGGLLALPDVDGGLIGGASLKAEDFLAIAGAVPASN